MVNSIGHILLAGGALLADSLQPESTVSLEEVNVLAVKQEARLREDAVSSTVLAGSKLFNRNVVALKGISEMVPNLFMPDYGSRVTSSIFVRGIGARMENPAVGMNIDNIPVLNKNGYDFDMADIASVEMLRGPQSTLYGRNTMGGLINITTISPMRWQGWRIMAEGGSGGSYKASVGNYRKLSERTGFSVAGNLNHVDGFYRNSYNNRLTESENGGGVKFKLYHRPTERHYFQNVASVSVVDQNGYPYESVESGEISYNDPCFYRRLLVSDGLTANYRGEGFNLTTVSSLQYLNDNLTLDQDFKPIPYFTLSQRQKEFSGTQDVVVKGSGFEGRYDWLGGAFLFARHMEMRAPVTFKDKGISDMIESHRNEMNPYYPIRWDSREFLLNSDFRIPTWGVALYHESKYRTGNWKFTAGMRVDYESSTLKYHSYCDTGYEVYRKTEGDLLEPYTHIEINVNDKGNIRRGYFNWIPRVSALYDFSEFSGNIYGSISKGYKSGGFNTQLFSDVLRQRLMNIMGIGGTYDVNTVVGYRPEYSWNYELGSHLQFFERRLDLDLSLYLIDCRDQQITMFPGDKATGRIMANAGRSRSFGGEFSMRASPFSMLDLNMSYGYTNARFLKFNDGLEDYGGRYVPYAPRHTLFLQALGHFDFSSGILDRILIDCNLRGVGRIYWDEGNTLMQNPYALLGASISGEFGNTTLQLWGRNLMNESYYTFYFKSMGNEFLQRGKPASVGVTLRILL